MGSGGQRDDAGRARVTAVILVAGVRGGDAGGGTVVSRGKARLIEITGGEFSYVHVAVGRKRGTVVPIIR